MTQAAMQNGTLVEKEKDLVAMSKQEFAKRRKILVTNLPDAVDLEDLKVNFLHGYDVLELKLDKSCATALLATPEQAKKALVSLNEHQFHGHVVGVTIPPPDSLLFVGNLPTDYSEEQFRKLMSPFGALERLFLVRSELTGESKGYGFVEFIDKDCATQAKQQLMTTGSRYVGGRILRIDFADPNLLTYEDLHSRTLFVDRLPRDFVDGEVFKQLFSQSGTVTFAQVAVNPQTGVSRGFAFVDFMTVEETERAQKAHNGALIEGSNIRVAFGTPGRSGASILRSLQGPTGFGPRGRGAPGVQPLLGGQQDGPRGPRPLMATRPRPPLLGNRPPNFVPRGPQGIMPRHPRGLRPASPAGGPPRPLMQSGPRTPMQGPGGPRGIHPQFRPQRHMLGMGRAGIRQGGPRFPGGPRGFTPPMGGSQVGNRAPAPPRGPMGPPRPLMMGVDGPVAEEPREEELGFGNDIKPEGPMPLMAANPHLEHHPASMVESALSPPRLQRQMHQQQPVPQAPQPVQGGQVMPRAPAPPQGAMPHQAAMPTQPLMSQVPVGVPQVQGQPSSNSLIGMPNQTPMQPVAAAQPIPLAIPNSVQSSQPHAPMPLMMTSGAPQPLLNTQQQYPLQGGQPAQVANPVPAMSQAPQFAVAGSFSQPQVVQQPNMQSTEQYMQGQAAASMPQLMNAPVPVQSQGIIESGIAPGSEQVPQYQQYNMVQQQSVEQVTAPPDQTQPQSQAALPYVVPQQQDAMVQQPSYQLPQLQQQQLQQQQQPQPLFYGQTQVVDQSQVLQQVDQQQGQSQQVYVTPQQQAPLMQQYSTLPTTSQAVLPQYQWQQTSAVQPVVAAAATGTPTHPTSWSVVTGQQDPQQITAGIGGQPVAVMQPQVASQSNSSIAYAQYQYQPSQAQVQVQATPTHPQQLVAAQQPVAVDPTHQYSQQADTTAVAAAAAAAAQQVLPQYQAQASSVTGTTPSPVPQHSAGPVMYNTEPAPQLGPGNSATPSSGQKRDLEADRTAVYGQPAARGYYDNTKRTRY